MDKIASSITIGIRELFRILVPGLMVIGYVKAEFPNLPSPWNGTASLLYILTLSFVVGLVVYVSKIHKWCPPWHNVFRQQINRLISEVRVALGGAPSLMPEFYHAEYKYILETKTDRYFTERVHYFTSFYYLLVEISQLFALFALAEFGLALYELLFASLPVIKFELSTPALLHLGGILLCVGGATLFHKSAKGMLGKTIDEQIIMVKVNRSKFESMQRSLKLEDITEKLKDACYKMLKKIVLNPDKRDYQIECTKISTANWGTGRDTVAYLLKIHTAYPITISGEPGGYKGFYKERVEAVLNHIASLYQEEDQSVEVTVEVVPTDDHHDNLESLVPIDKARKEIISEGSPLDKVASKFDIPYVLVRGRHLVGPNPGLLRVVEKICQKATPKSALDLFSGTGIISRFLKSQGVESITCVDKGGHFDTLKGVLEKLPGITCVKEDAFHFRIPQVFDLIVADPYYEDAINFLNTKAKEIFANTGIFVFVCGGVEHEYQRDQCKELIRSLLEVEPEEHLEYGLSVLVCHKPN